MKKKIFFIMIFCFMAMLLNAHCKVDCFDLNKLKNISGVLLVDSTKEISLDLNQEQVKMFAAKMKVSKKSTPKKSSYPYTVHVYYVDDNGDGGYISLMTDGKYLVEDKSSECYEFTNDCSDFIESIFSIYNSFLVPVAPTVCVGVGATIPAGSKYVFQKVGENRYYVLHVVYGSGLPVIGMTVYDVESKNNCIELDDDTKFVIEGKTYKCYYKDDQYNFEAKKSSIKDVQIDMSDFYMYHH